MLGVGMAIGGLASAAGSIGGSLLSADMSKKAADKAARWQLYMSNTAHQRAVKDLRAAGLNPILAANSPASTGQMPMPNIPDMGQSVNSGLNTGVSSAIQFAQARQALKSGKLDLEAKAGAYKWLKDNPQVQTLFNAGLIANLAGLPSHIYPLLMGVSSSSSVKRMFHDAVNPGNKAPMGLPRDSIVEGLFPNQR